MIELPGSLAGNSSSPSPAWSARPAGGCHGDGEQRHGQAPQLSHGLHQGVMARHHGKQVVRRLKVGSRSAGEFSTNLVGKSVRRVQSTADGCASERQSQ